MCDEIEIICAMHRMIFDKWWWGAWYDYDLLWVIYVVIYKWWSRVCVCVCVCGRSMIHPPYQSPNAGSHLVLRVSKMQRIVSHNGDDDDDGDDECYDGDVKNSKSWLWWWWWWWMLWWWHEKIVSHDDDDDDDECYDGDVKNS